MPTREIAETGEGLFGRVRFFCCLDADGHRNNHNICLSRDFVLKYACEFLFDIKRKRPQNTNQCLYRSR
jgi:hypothetical protein